MESGIIEKFSEMELSFLLLSLDEFERKINEFKRITNNQTNLNNADLNLGFMSSVRQKFNEHDHKLTLNEAKVLYCSVDDRRDFINAALDDGLDNEEDHLDALECLRIANSIIRKLKAAFLSIGIDIADRLDGNTQL